MVGVVAVAEGGSVVGIPGTDEASAGEQADARLKAVSMRYARRSMLLMVHEAGRISRT
jgi:hypothetical protein